MGHWLSLERLSNTDQMRACAGWSDSSMDSGPVLLRHPIFFVIFSDVRGVRTRCPPSRSVHDPWSVWNSGISKTCNTLEVLC